jgi:hypothetical protein
MRPGNTLGSGRRAAPGAGAGWTSFPEYTRQAAVIPIAFSIAGRCASMTWFRSVWNPRCTRCPPEARMLFPRYQARSSSSYVPYATSVPRPATFALFLRDRYGSGPTHDPPYWYVRTVDHGGRPRSREWVFWANVLACSRESHAAGARQRGARPGMPCSPGQVFPDQTRSLGSIAMSQARLHPARDCQPTTRPQRVPNPFAVT